MTASTFANPPTRRRSRVLVAVATLLTVGGLSQGFAAQPAREAVRLRADARYRAVVDLPTFMEHVLTPAADKIWLTSGTIGDATGERDLTPTTPEQWEQVVSGAATLVEAVNALVVPERARDQAWLRYSAKLSEAAEDAWRAAEARDVAGIQRVSARLDGVCADCHRHYGVE